MIPESEQLKQLLYDMDFKERKHTPRLYLCLGFEFKKVKFGVVDGIVQVDGNNGWRFNMFVDNDDEDQCRLSFMSIDVEWLVGVEGQSIFKRRC
jgi:hypothetical protein